MDFPNFISSSNWIFAKTMPEIPHEYVVRSPENETDFLAFAQFIRDNGYKARFRNMKHSLIYYDFDDYRYWTMGNPLAETTILNRSRLDQYERIETADGIIIM